MMQASLAMVSAILGLFLPAFSTWTAIHSAARARPSWVVMKGSKARANRSAAKWAVIAVGSVLNLKERVR
jgi:hypothetical protein